MDLRIYSKKSQKIIFFQSVFDLLDGVYDIHRKNQGDLYVNIVGLNRDLHNQISS